MDVDNSKAKSAQYLREQRKGRRGSRGRALEVAVSELHLEQVGPGRVQMERRACQGEGRA